MAQLFSLRQEQAARIRTFRSRERGGKRVDDSKVLSGIITVIQKGLRWVDAPRPMVPTKSSTTASGAGQTRVPLICFLSCQHPMA